jgi:hypothetical protein
MRVIPCYGRRVFGFRPLDFARFDEGVTLRSYALQKHRRGFVGGVLWDELARHREREDFRFLTRKSVVDLNTGVYIPHSELLSEYIFICFSTIDFRNLFKGGILPTLDRSVVEKRAIPIPPINEQARIVERVNYLLQLIELFNC